MFAYGRCFHLRSSFLTWGLPYFGVGIHFCTGSSHEVEFAVPTDDTRVARMISGCRVILVFLKIILKCGWRLQQVVLYWNTYGVFFSQLLLIFQPYKGTCCLLYSCLLKYQSCRNWKHVLAKNIQVINRLFVHIEILSMEDTVATGSYLQGMSCHFFFFMMWNLTKLLDMYFFNYWIFKTYIFRWLDVGWNLFWPKHVINYSMVDTIRNSCVDNNLFVYAASPQTYVVNLFQMFSCKLKMCKSNNA